MQSGIRLSPEESLHFALRLGGHEDREPSFEVTPEDCELTELPADSSNTGGCLFTHKDTGLEIELRASADRDRCISKWLVIKHGGENPFLLFDVVLDRALLGGSAHLSGGGKGWPVFIHGIGFVAVEFPESENIISEQQYSLEYYPAVVLNPGETYDSEKAVLLFSNDGPQETLSHYASEIRLRKQKEPFAVYSSWGAHDYEGPSGHIVNEQLDHVTDLKSKWRVPFEYFVVDYGYWDEQSLAPSTGRFSAIDERERFADGSFDALTARIREANLKLGMYFDAGYCTRPGFAAALSGSFVEMIRRHGMKMIKADVEGWHCDDETDGSFPAKYMCYQAAKRAIAAFAAAREADPEVVVLAVCPSCSPWWLEYADYSIGGKAETPDVPAPSIRESQMLEVDMGHRLPEFDSGTEVGYSDSNCWCGRQQWRKGLVMSISRSNEVLLAGDLGLLDEEDRLFFQRIADLMRIHRRAFGNARRVLGDPARGETYGYANVHKGRGLVAVFNPSWEPRRIEIQAADLGCDPSVRNVCIQLFPKMEGASILADGGHFHAHIAPWEVQLLEVGPSEEHSELLELKHKADHNCALHVTQVMPQPDGPDSLDLELERTYFHTGSTYRTRTVLPQNWGGFPLLADMNGLRAEIYVNNRPVCRMGSDLARVLLYPWTPEYGLMRFGAENLFYAATHDVEPASAPRLSLRALPYFSSSACREDWQHHGSATMVVIVRYLKDGQPYRHSVEPRDAQCAVWVDGVWMQPYRVPPLVPRVWAKYSWAVFMLDLEGDWECARILVPQLVDCDYEVEFFLTNSLRASACAD